MIIPGQIKCDVCGAVKGETNHWLVAVTVSNRAGIMFIPAECVEESRNPLAVYEDICGHDCAHKHFSRWLESPWTLPAQPERQSA